MTDSELLELRQRNERRAAEAIKALGKRWLLHPANATERKPGAATGNHPLFSTTNQRRTTK